MLASHIVHITQKHKNKECTQACTLRNEIYIQILPLPNLTDNVDKDLISAWYEVPSNRSHYSKWALNISAEKNKAVLPLHTYMNVFASAFPLWHLSGQAKMNSTPKILFSLKATSEPKWWHSLIVVHSFPLLKAQNKKNTQMGGL